MERSNKLIKNDVLVWKLVTEDGELKVDLIRLKEKAFSNQLNNSKQKLVYDLLEAVKNNDQNRFFYSLLRSINKPKEGYTKLYDELEKNYNILPEQAFVNFAYSIIVGIMATYKDNNGGNSNE